MTITNEHLLKAIHEMTNFIVNGTEPPEDLVFTLIMELSASNLVMAANEVDDGIDFAHLQARGQEFLPLFTDMDKISKFSDEYGGIENEFSYYQELVNERKFDGAVINCDHEGFVIDSKLINDIPSLKSTQDKPESDVEKLKEMAFNADNSALLSFIHENKNFRNYDDLKDIIADSVLLNVVLPASEVTSDDGIIKRADAGGFSLLDKKNGREHYGVLFTDADAIKQSGFTHFQISNLFETVKFILNNDMDGIIINPDSEDYIIPRNVLLDIILDERLKKDDLANAFDYAFEV